tara:strand:+ start:3335 stop:4192 length:858 start_codon:yes stop_codon:yes gene_type:complete
MKLLSKNAKLEKTHPSLNYSASGVSLAPANQAGVGNVCPDASEGCKAACLFTAGRAAIWTAINEARIAKTQFFFADTQGFMAQLVKEIASYQRACNKKGIHPAIRLNTISDLAWEKITIGKTKKNIFETFPTIQFYDYTKSLRRALKQASQDKIASNYDLTFSLSESNKKSALKVLAAGGNVAAVFFKFNLSDTWEGYNLINGDLHDLRFVDEKGGKVVALKAKGEARIDKTGFVITLPRYEKEQGEILAKSLAKKLAAAKGKLASMEAAKRDAESVVRALELSC